MFKSKLAKLARLHHHRSMRTPSRTELRRGLPILTQTFPGKITFLLKLSTTHSSQSCSGAGWVYELAQQNDSQVAFHDTYQVGRLQNLAGIDDMVGAVMQKLEDSKLLDNTYVIFTTDNGFHIGSHRMAPGKRQGYEEDINIPMMIRGPDVPVGFVTNHTQSHTDLAPTILSMMGLPLRGDFDGAPFPITQADLTNPALDTEYVSKYYRMP